jgi:PAS domain S-box-containing protein
MNSALSDALLARITAAADDAGITPEVFVQRLLNASEAPLSSEFFDLSLDPLCIVSTNGRFIRINPALERLIGVDNETARQYSYYEFLHPDDIQITGEVITEQLAKGQGIVRLSNRARAIDGSYRWLEWTARPAGNGLIYAGARDVTEQRALREALEAQVAHTKMIVESITDAYFTLDYDWRFVSVNPEGERLMRLSRDELLGETLWALFPLLRTTEPHAHFNKAMTERVSVTYTVFYEPFEAWFEVRIVPVDAGLAVFFRDVTEHQNLVNRLYASEERYRVMVESQIDLVSQFDANTNLTYFNDAYAKFFGITPETHLGKSFLGEVVSDDHSFVLARVERLLRDPHPGVTITRNLDAEGRVRWVQWVDHGITDQNGNVTQIQAVGRDVTRLVEIENELHRKESEWRLLFEQNPLPMWVYDTETLRFMTVNEAAIRSYGYTREEFLGMSIRDIRPEVDTEQLTQRLAELDDSPSTGTEWVHRRKDGSLFNVLISSNAVEWGGRRGRLVLAADITERKQYEAQQMYAQKLEIELAKEREVSELKERFMSIVSHEYRTPLSIIKLTSDLLLNYADRLSIDNQKEKLERIRSQVDRMQHLLEDVMTITRANLNKQLFMPESMELVTFARMMLENIELTDGGKHQFEYRPAKPALHVTADPRLLDHVLTNLLSNAVKYSPEGTTVRLTLDESQDFVEIDVHDEGIGIPEADQSRVFQPFHRARNASSHPGTGLGLAIVKQYVEMHGGNVWFESIENHGTSFKLHLPRRPLPPPEI